MSNGRIFYNNIIDDATVTVSTEETGFEKKYLTDDSQAEVWRSETPISEYIKITFAAATNIKNLIALNSNLNAGDVIKIEASTDDFITISESETVTFTGNDFFYNMDWTYRYYRITVTRDTTSYYYQEVDIVNNEVTDLTDYQVKFTIDTATLIASTKLNINATNMRVLDSLGAEIPFGYISEGWNTATTEFWCKIDILGSATDTYKFSYGRADWLLKTADLSLVFSFVDEFSGAVMDTTKWADIGVGSTPTISAGKLVFDSTETRTIKSTPLAAPSSASDWIYTFYVASATASKSNTGGIDATDNYRAYLFYGDVAHGSNWSSQTQNAGAQSIVSVGANAGAQMLLENALDNKNSKLRNRLNGGSWIDNSTQYPVGIDLYLYIVNYIGGTLDVEYVHIRKYTTTEPTVTVGAETFIDSGAYIEIGEIYASGSDCEFTNNYNWNYDDQDIEEWITKTTEGGQTFRTLQFSKKAYSVNFKAIESAQNETFKAIAKNAYVIFFPDGITDVLYFGIINYTGKKHFQTNYWKINMLFEESPS